MNWYGFIIACGIVLCVVAAYFVSKHRGLEGDTVVDILIFGLPLAIVFARIYYVVFDLIDPNGQDWTFTKFIGIDDHGLQGLAIYGALIGVVIGMFLLSLWKNRKKNPVDKRISFMQILDLVFAFVILGQAVGRWGNFANEEAHGYAVTDPSKMWFPLAVNVSGTWYYATFFYEFVWNLIGFGILMYLYIGKRKSFDGFIFACYCIYYGIGRSWIEGMREDSLWLVPPTDPSTGAGGIRVSQLLSILLIIFGLVYIIVHIVRAKKAGKKVFIFVNQSKLNADYFDYEKTKLAHPMPDIKFFKFEKKLMGLPIETEENTDDGEKPNDETPNGENESGGSTADIEEPSETITEDKTETTKKTEQTEQGGNDYEDRWDD